MNQDKEKTPAGQGEGHDTRKVNQMSNANDTSLVEVIDGEPRVSTTTIADKTGNGHRGVIQLVRANLADLESFGRVAFEIAPLQTAGGVQRREVAQLNEQQGTLLITYLKNTPSVRELKLKLVQDFYAMRQMLVEQNKTPALTEDEIVLQALQITNRKVKALEAKVAEDAPKVDYVDTFAADDDKILFRTVASSLDMTEKALRQLLIAKGWIYAEETTRWSEKRQEKVKITRYSEYSHKKLYFYRRLENDAPRFRGEVMWTLKITPAGASAIARLVKNMEVAA